MRTGLYLTVISFSIFSVDAFAYYNVFSFFKKSSSVKTLVQSGNNALYPGSTDPTFSFPTAPTPHNFVWVSIATWSGGVTSVTDNQGNTYGIAFSQASGCNVGLYGYYALNVASTGTFTITIHGTGVYSTHFREYSGVATSSAIDQSASSNGNSAAAASGPITTSQDGELYIAAQAHCSTLTTSAGSGWTNHVITTEDSNNYQGLSTADRIGAPAGTYNGEFSFSGGDNWGAGIASFK